jgi:transcriptional regulator with XRE-family HTH domain
MSITTAQIRGARGILNWSQQDLAQRTGISATSIGAIENGQTTPRESTLSTIRKTLENAGIEFIGLEGIRQKTGEVRILTGREGFKTFYDDVYEVVRSISDSTTVYVSNVDESQFLKFGADILQPHSERILALGTVKYKILIKEGDTNFVASDYAVYKWLPKSQFSTVPFYIYGPKIAILLFGAEPTVIILNYPAIAEAFTIQFITSWKTALEPNEK